MSDTSYGLTYSGFGQAGLPSEQYPDVPPIAGPVANLGISQVGTWADGVYIGQYRVSGQVMQYGRWYYQCKVGRAVPSAPGGAGSRTVFVGGQGTARLR